MRGSIRRLIGGIMTADELRQMFQRAEVNREIARLKLWLKVIAGACVLLLAALAGLLAAVLRGRL